MAQHDQAFSRVVRVILRNEINIMDLERSLRERVTRFFETHGLGMEELERIQFFSRSEMTHILRMDILDTLDTIPDRMAINRDEIIGLTGERMLDKAIREDFVRTIRFEAVDYYYYNIYD